MIGDCTCRHRRRRRKLGAFSLADQEYAMERLALLKQLSFGLQVAEDEVNAIANYFVETDLWDRIINGEIDIIRGEKGTGKSAIYLLLEQNRDLLFDRGVILVSAEKPRGTTVFKDLIPDPPTTEQEFIILWKIYLVTIIAHELRSLGLGDSSLTDVYLVLEEASLLETELNLSGLLRTCQNLVRRLLGSSIIETEVELDPVTGSPTGIIGRLSLAEPSGELRSQGIMSVDGLYETINEALAATDYQVWVALDRLDVAFQENHQLEANALRALIRVYGDLRGFDDIYLKIFLREDIWNRITEGGLREASHIIRYATVNWTNNTLLNLLMRRILNNDVLLDELSIDKAEILDDFSKQEQLFERLFPEKVEQGPRNPTTFKWMVTRCADGTGNTAPRELIHFLNSLQNEEIKRLEVGGKAAPEDQLFDRSVFKQALPIVSNSRLNTYLYAEYPEERQFVEKLKGQKSEQTAESLMTLWGVDRSEAIARAGKLVDLGFFEEKGSRSSPTFWVPFLYRDALDLVQGKADLDAV